ncbi:hypothetical protein G6F57_021158 [Rhizopus arrhizus]|nr:hypothetical protein G6F57_021158 [Rhizopus arrhizus]
MGGCRPTSSGPGVVSFENVIGRVHALRHPRRRDHARPGVRVGLCYRAAIGPLDPCHGQPRSRRQARAAGQPAEDVVLRSRQAT